MGKARRASPALWQALAVGIETHPPRQAWWFANHARRPEGRVVFQYTLAGRMAFELGPERHDVAAHEAVPFVYGEASAYGMPADAAEPIRTTWVAIEGAGLADHIAELRAMNGPVFHFGSDRAVLRRIESLRVEADPPQRPDALAVGRAVHALVMALYEHATQVRSASQTATERAIDELLRTPAAGWSLKQVAVRHGVSREHLTRVFTERLGVCPARYLDDARLRRALDLLEQTDLPVAEVARQSGYGTAHTLSRHLRRREGRSPSAVRRRLRRDQSDRPPRE